MCAQNADVCTELKHESVTAVKPRKSKRGFSHAVAHNVGRTRIRIRGNEPNFDIRPSIKMSTFSYDSSFSPAGLLLHNGNKPLPLGTVTLLLPQEVLAPTSGVAYSHLKTATGQHVHFCE